MLYSIMRVAGLSLLIIIIGCGVMYTSYSPTTEESVDTKVREIYRGIIAQTGQAQDALPLRIDESLEINAYNTGKEIVVHRGFLISAANWDEVALVLGHEVAHGMLGHLKMHLEKATNAQVAVLEGNADKMGAVYALKAGWNVCRGREIFKTWKKERGNSQGENHPDYSYRFDELNIGCD